MTTPRTANKATLALQAAWIKAATAPKPFEFRCPTPAVAMQFRIRLYGAVKGVRDRQESNPALADALAQCSVRVDPQDKCLVRLGRIQDLDPMMEQVEAILGQSISDLLTPEAAAAEASLQRLLQGDLQQRMPEAPSLDGIKNPYY